jgi:hypothetical protein
MPKLARFYRKTRCKYAGFTQLNSAAKVLRFLVGPQIQVETQEAHSVNPARVRNLQNPLQGQMESFTSEARSAFANAGQTTSEIHVAEHTIKNVCRRQGSNTRQASFEFKQTRAHRLAHDSGRPSQNRKFIAVGHTGTQVERLIPKRYTDFVRPDGQRAAIINRARFCRESELSVVRMHNLKKSARNIHKGWPWKKL